MLIAEVTAAVIASIVVVTAVLDGLGALCPAPPPFLLRARSSEGAEGPGR